MAKQLAYRYSFYGKGIIDPSYSKRWLRSPPTTDTIWAFLQANELDDVYPVADVLKCLDEWGSFVAVRADNKVCEIDEDYV